METTQEGYLSFGDDGLRREATATRIAELLEGLADAELLPAGRVLAVDAPWGSGKTWIAQRLPGVLDKRPRRSRAIYINAFESDFHHDPFVVLCSAVMNAARGKLRRGFKDAALQVAKTSVPELATGAVRQLGKWVFGEAPVEAVEAAAKLTDIATKQLFDRFEASQKAAAAFKTRLSALAVAESAPLVLIIDELDRCRPTFALEMLERIKHLFDVPCVAFALFMHAGALHSAIRQTYGVGIDPHAYLRKFVSVSVGLPKTFDVGVAQPDTCELAEAFLASAYAAPTHASLANTTFRSSLAGLSPCFQATLRDLQTAMFLAQLFPREVEHDPLAAAFVLLMRVVDPVGLRDFRRGGAQVCERELSRIRENRSTSGAVAPIAEALAAGREHAMGTAVSRPDHLQVFQSMQRSARRLDVDNLRL
nr:P-loop NTPase fold protein [uncultured Roseateles sp.]